MRTRTATTQPSNVNYESESTQLVPSDAGYKAKKEIFGLLLRLLSAALLRNPADFVIVSRGDPLARVSNFLATKKKNPEICRFFPHNSSERYFVIIEFLLFAHTHADLARIVENFVKGFSPLLYLGQAIRTGEKMKKFSLMNNRVILLSRIAII